MDHIAEMFRAVLSVTPWAAALILLLMALRKAAEKWLSPRFFQLAFLILALRLALPFDFSLPEAPVRLELPQPVATQQVAEEPHFPVVQAELPTGPHLRLQPPVSPDPQPVRKTIRWSAVLPVVWFVGAAVFFVFRVSAYGLFCLRLMHRRRLADERIRQQAAEAFGHPVRVYLAPEIPSPMLAGLLCPAVYLPEHEIGPSALPYVLAHEACHARRCDLWAQVLLLAVQSVRWFDPLVHWMARTARQDMERGCDENVLSGKTMEYRKAYGRAVLSTLRTASQYPAPVLSTGFSGSGDLKRRFREMFDFKKKSRGLPLLAALLLLVAAASMLVACGSVKAANEAPSAVLSEPAASVMEDRSIPAVQGGDWGWPLEEDVPCVIMRVMSSRHKGMDIQAQTGTPLYALFDGTVTAANPDHYSYGQYLQIESTDHSRAVLYAHCSVLLVQEGDTVTAGQQVAEVGATGNVGDRGWPQVHVETFVASGEGTASALERVQPADLLTIPGELEVPQPGEGEDLQGGEAAAQYQDLPAWPADQAIPASSEEWVFPYEDGAWKYMARGVTESHPAVDLAADAGTDIRAAHGGIVVAAEYDYGYGNFLAIENPSDGFTTLYAHCDRLYVKAGDTVEAGQVIAATGNTGTSTGNHLHLCVYYNDCWLDPLDYIPHAEGLDAEAGQPDEGYEADAVPPADQAATPADIPAEADAQGYCPEHENCREQEDCHGWEHCPDPEHCPEHRSEHHSERHSGRHCRR